MGVAADYVSRTKIGAYFHSIRESRKLILFIVAVALLLDNMLLTTVGKNIDFFHTVKRKTKMADFGTGQKTVICKNRHFQVTIR